MPRETFQQSLAELNPAWAEFLAEMLAVGALDSENPDERKKKGLKTNPDGDVDLPDAPYTTFRYPACPTCLQKPPTMPDGTTGKVGVDRDGAWSSDSTAGVLKPAVIMFGESIKVPVKAAAEKAVDDASRILVIGSSLATYSAWRLVKQAKDQGMPIGVLNIGGVRGEEKLFDDIPASNQGALGMRCSESSTRILPSLVDMFRGNAQRSMPSESTWHNSASFGRME
jgi:NAD-dependent deacetylase sirtuin 4